MVSRMSRRQTDSIFEWWKQVDSHQENVVQVPPRLPTPVPSESGETVLSILDAARIEQEDLPEVIDIEETWGTRAGGVLATVLPDRVPGLWMIEEWDKVSV